MPHDPSTNRFIARANESMEENLARNERTVLTCYGLIGAILLLGGMGYLLDRWMGTGPWLLLAGVGAGTIIGLGRLYRLVRHS